MKPLLILIALLVAIGLLFWRVAVERSLLNVTRSDIHFPTVSGSNLMRERMTFPADFAGDLNILFIPFLQDQQLIVNTWIPFAQETEAAYPSMAYYEFPTIYEMSTARRTFLNEGMRAGIPDPTSRERTVTLYVDLDQFHKATGITGKDKMHTMLVNRNGDILWRTTGNFSDAKGAELISAIEANG